MQINDLNYPRLRSRACNHSRLSCGSAHFIHALIHIDAACLPRILCKANSFIEFRTLFSRSPKSHVKTHLGDEKRRGQKWMKPSLSWTEFMIHHKFGVYRCEYERTHLTRNIIDFVINVTMSMMNIHKSGVNLAWSWNDRFRISCRNLHTIKFSHRQQGRLFLMCTIVSVNAGTTMRLHVYLWIHSRLHAMYVCSMQPRDFTLFFHRFAYVILEPSSLA